MISCKHSCECVPSIEKIYLRHIITVLICTGDGSLNMSRPNEGYIAKLYSVENVSYSCTFSVEYIKQRSTDTLTEKIVLKIYICEVWLLSIALCVCVYESELWGESYNVVNAITKGQSDVGIIFISLSYLFCLRLCFDHTSSTTHPPVESQYWNRSLRWVWSDGNNCCQRSDQYSIRKLGLI